MTQHTFTLTASILFFIIALLHLARLLQEWEVTVHAWKMPFWFSVAALLVAGVLSLSGFKLARVLK